MTTLSLLLALAAAGPEAPPERRVVIALGSSRGAPGEAPLRFAARDAERIAEVFETLGGAEPQDAIVAIDADLPGVRAIFADVAARLAAVGGAGAVFVYYSGHADLGGLHLGDETLPFAELRALTLALPARLRVVVVDGCRSGGLTQRKGARAADEFPIAVEPLEQIEGLALITSSAADEDSRESERLESSLFTHHLLAALRGAADRDDDQQVTLAEAYEYTYTHTLRSSRATSSLQHPTHSFDLRGRGAFVLTRLGGRDRRGGLLTLAEPGLYLISREREDGPVAAEVSSDREGRRVSLPAGRYFVQRRAREHFDEYEIEVRVGETRALAEVPRRQVEYARLVRKGGERAAVHGLGAMATLDGEILAGRGPALGARLEYGADLPWLSLSGRVRAATRLADAPLGGDELELAIGAAAHRAFDLPVVSLAVGLAVDAVYRTQRFQTDGLAPDRSALGLSFGPYARVEVDVTGGLALRVEGGPLTHVFPRAEVVAGAPGETSLAAVTTWSAAAGLGYRF